MLFDWLVVGHVIDINPPHAVRGPKHVVKKGRAPVLDREEAVPQCRSRIAIFTELLPQHNSFQRPSLKALLPDVSASSGGG
jgi:hypothetical protein